MNPKLLLYIMDCAVIDRIQFLAELMDVKKTVQYNMNPLGSGYRSEQNILYGKVREREWRDGSRRK